MHRLTFQERGVSAYANAHDEQSAQNSYTTENTADYGLWLVKDDGIYVMAPSESRDLDNNGVHVIYANGYDRNEPDIWDKTYEVSPDDFAELSR